MSRIVFIEAHSLSDGGTAQITRLGHKYNFNRLYPDSRPPECHIGISLKEARDLCAEVLYSDVLETDI
jgi:hypothetical protein